MKRYEKFMRGKNAENLADAIEENFQQMERLEISHQKMSLKMESALHGITSTFHKIGIVKYDAFNQMGGKLSFCLALLDENNNGFILNSVHSTEGCYSYTKEIQNGICEISLGNEEEKALNMAMEIIE